MGALSILFGCPWPDPVIRHQNGSCYYQGMEELHSHLSSMSKWWVLHSYPEMLSAVTHLLTRVRLWSSSLWMRGQTRNGGIVTLSAFIAPHLMASVPLSARITRLSCWSNLAALILGSYWTVIRHVSSALYVFLNRSCNETMEVTDCQGILGDRLHWNSLLCLKHSFICTIAP